MHRFSVRCAVLASLVVGLAVVGACGDGGLDDARANVPSCDKLKAQIDGCSTVPQATKDAFLTTCATLPDSCRSCYEGKLCDSTEGCERLCK